LKNQSSLEKDIIEGDNPVQDFDSFTAICSNEGGSQGLPLSAVSGSKDRDGLRLRTYIIILKSRVV